MTEQVSFSDSQGNLVSGLLSLSESPNGKVMILCHGAFSSKESSTFRTLEPLLLSKGISVFRFDFYAHGESQGRPEDLTLSKCIDDIFCAISLMQSRGFHRLGLLGSSMGGYAALIAASQTDALSLLCLKCPVSDWMTKGNIFGKSPEEMKEWKEKGIAPFVRGTIDIPVGYGFVEELIGKSGHDVCPLIHVQTLIVHGTLDKSVPVEQSIKTHELILGSRLEIIKGADHYFSLRTHFDKMIALFAEFIGEKL